jgi:hypothetical protein
MYISVKVIFLLQTASDFYFFVETLPCMRKFD